MWKNIFSLATSLIGGSSVQIYIYLGLVFGSFGAGFYVEHLRFANFQDEIKIVAEKQIAQNQAKTKEQELINKGVTDAYEARINSIHLMYSGMHNTSSSPVSNVPNATITINGTTVNTLDFAEQCANTTQQLESTQDWIRSQIGLN
jgi:hypothetical protein